MLHHHRTPQADANLGYLLATLAGALNAGAFLVVGQYTGHLSGMVSSVADNLILHAWHPILIALAGISSFIAGAATCAVLVTWARRHAPACQYALPLFLESLLILLFAAVQLRSYQPVHPVAGAISLLAFIMGLQNATITKASGARIRTTHVTGISTDIGIELGKLVYGTTDHSKLALLTGLLTCFFSGGVIGALGFQTYATAFAIPLGLLLLAFTLPVLVVRRT